MTVAPVDSDVAHGAVPEIEQILLESKTAVGAPLPGSVSRDLLIREARDSGRRIVAITAPAGYGKSTLLAEWAQTEKRVVCWATVDRFDDDPGALLSLLAAATQHITADGSTLASKMRGTKTTLLARSAPLLARMWHSATVPFVLFIDDFHLASSADCLDAFIVALQGVPEGSQVVIASRETQPYLARMRVGGTVFDLHAGELRMNHQEVEEIFTRNGGPVSREVIAAALDRSEGWPAGVFLSALTSMDAPGSQITGDSGPIADYLYRECLAGLRPELQDFLIDTAVLDEMSPELCDFVRESTTSLDMLHTTQSLGLFLSAIDGRQQWYRYHALFREFLLREGERRDRQRVRVLHVRAADWYEAHGVARQSIEHLIEAGETTRAVNSAARVSLAMFQRGDAATLERWGSALGEAVVISCPPLAVMSAWKSALFGESPAAEIRAAALEHVDAAVLEPAARAPFEAGRALVRASLCAHGPEEMLRDALFAAENAPPGTPWHGPSLYLRGEARLLNADLPGAERDLTDAVDACTIMGNTTALLLSHANLSILAADRGDWDGAARHADTGLRTVEATPFEGYPMIVLALAVAARVAHEAADDASSTLLSRAMRARVQSTHTFPHVAMRARLQLALVFRARGDEAAAVQLAREAVLLMHRRPKMGALAREVEDFLQGSRTQTPVAAAPAVVLTPAEMRLLPYLQTHLTLEEIGRRLYLSRATISSQASSIYRKLAAERRGAAVEAARGLGLLS
ncbi:LuxR family transcriptional regulator [Microbacterium sp. AGC85]